MVAVWYNKIWVRSFFFWSKLLVYSETCLQLAECQVSDKTFLL